MLDSVRVAYVLPQQLPHLENEVKAASQRGHCDRNVDAYSNGYFQGRTEGSKQGKIERN